MCSENETMNLTFYKYQGTGNDFVIIDNRDLHFPKENTQLVNHLCDRRFGIGADGLMLLENAEGYDFRMVYYNSDGNEGTMCGNGGRCLVAFAKEIGVIDSKTTFIAVDGEHHATIENGIVSLQMIDVSGISLAKTHTFMDTGSPHHVQQVDDVNDVNVKIDGANIRYNQLYKADGGTNVNFVSPLEGADNFAIRTYERGVEDETLSCGTGATATAIAMKVRGQAVSNEISLQTKGGQLQVSFEEMEGVFKNVFLKGPAQLVFKGTIDAQV